MPSDSEASENDVFDDEQDEQDLLKAAAVQKLKESQQQTVQIKEEEVDDPGSGSGSSLSEAQKRRTEKNRLKALALKQSRIQGQKRGHDQDQRDALTGTEKLAVFFLS